MTDKTIAIPWACPKCGAKANEHGKGGFDKCLARVCRAESACQGFLCECDRDTAPEHGQTFTDPCPNATCFHCGFGGTVPQKPKGLQAWEKKALDAGWTPAAARAKELGIHVGPAMEEP